MTTGAWFGTRLVVVEHDSTADGFLDMSTATKIRSFPTPNPRSMKFTGDGRRFAPAGVFSFNSPREAVGNTLGEALFAVAGVANVLILPDFVTVSLSDAADWPSRLPRLLEILDEYSDETS